MLEKKCIFIFGPESSGSRLMSKTLAHALDIREFDRWDGSGMICDDTHKVWHESLPAGVIPSFPDVEQMIAEHEKDYSLYFILTTRDITISESSRIARFNKPHSQVHEDSSMAREIMLKLMRSDRKIFIWSYESFMYLGQDYLNLLYRFLDIDSNFMPQLNDGNKVRLLKNRIYFKHSRTIKLIKTIVALIKTRGWHN